MTEFKKEYLRLPLLAQSILRTLDSTEAFDLITLYEGFIMRTQQKRGRRGLLGGAKPFSRMPPPVGPTITCCKSGRRSRTWHVSVLTKCGTASVPGKGPASQPASLQPPDWTRCSSRACGTRGPTSSGILSIISRAESSIHGKAPALRYLQKTKGLSCLHSMDRID